MLITLSLFPIDLVVPDTFEGDIVLTPLQLEQLRVEASSRETRAVTMMETAKWPGGIVPYELSPDLSMLLHCNYIIIGILKYACACVI